MPGVPVSFVVGQPTEIILVEDMLGYRVWRPRPIPRVALQFDRADCTRANVSAAPKPRFRPKFAANEKIGVFHAHHGSLKTMSKSGECKPVPIRRLCRPRMQSKAKRLDDPHDGKETRIPPFGQ